RRRQPRRPRRIGAAIRRACCSWGARSATRPSLAPAVLREAWSRAADRIVRRWQRSPRWTRSSAGRPIGSWRRRLTGASRKVSIAIGTGTKGEGPSEEGPSVAAGFANRKGIFHERFPALPLPKPTHGLAISGESLCEQPRKDTSEVGYGSMVGG